MYLCINKLQFTFWGGKMYYGFNKLQFMLFRRENENYSRKKTLEYSL